MKAVFVKLGGSVITDKTSANSAQHQTIKNLAHEISKIRRSNPDLVWFIGNGAGSFGHFAVHQTGWKDKTNDPLSIAQIRLATSKLNNLILDALLAEAVPALSLPPAAFAYRTNQKASVDATSLLAFAKLGNVPLVYGDMIFDADQGAHIMSTEESLDELAQAWLKEGGSIQSYVFCTSVDGVLDASNQTISTLSKDGDHSSISSAKGVDVTGGMKQKVAYAFKALSYTDHVYIINGQKTGHLTKAVNQEPVDTKLAA